MRENRVRTIWQQGGFVLNGWLHIPNSFAAELMSQQGWDSLTIDMQHGPVDYQAALGMLQAISTTNVTPFARVPWNEPGIIMKMLDAGCYGIICPMINTRAQCEAFVGACRYPPRGYRSMGPTRATLYAGADYAANANHTVITMAMIETKEALGQLDDILSVPGLDAIYVGPSDLSQSMGRGPSSDYAEPDRIAWLEQIIAAAKRHNIFAGIHTGSADYALRVKALGYQFATVGSDGRMMAMASQQVVAKVKGDAGAQPKTQVGPY